MIDLSYEKTYCNLIFTEAIKILALNEAKPIQLLYISPYFPPLFPTCGLAIPMVTKRIFIQLFIVILRTTIKNAEREILRSRTFELSGLTLFTYAFNFRQCCENLIKNPGNPQEIHVAMVWLLLYFDRLLTPGGSICTLLLQLIIFL